MEEEIGKEKSKLISQTLNGISFKYKEVYHLDYYVDPETGICNEKDIIKYYTKEQTDRNLKKLNNSYSNAIRKLKIKKLLEND